jgi:hypothetical protein
VKLPFKLLLKLPQPRRPTLKNLTNTIEELAILAGFLMLLRGLWLVYPPLMWIIGGLWLMFPAKAVR